YVSPWVNALWPLTPRVSLRAGGGVYRQAPAFDEVLGVNGGAALQSSRAYDVDVGVEGLVGSTARWQVTAYDREDRDLPRLPGTESRASAGGAFINGSRNGKYANALDGYARGVELALQRQTPNGLSGWVSYALGF